MMCKLCQKIPEGFSRSVDKVRLHLKETTVKDVQQFLKDPAKNELRFINPDTLKLQLKAVTEEHTTSKSTLKKDSTDSGKEEESKVAATTEKKEQPVATTTSSSTKGEDEELESIKLNEKTVNIRFGNYSMLMRAQQYGISSKLLALLGGLQSNASNAPAKNNKDLIDATEDKLIKEKEKEHKDKSWDWLTAWKSLNVVVLSSKIILAYF